MFLDSVYNQNILIDINLLEKHNNLDSFLLHQLKNNIGNKCNHDGLILKDTIQIINRNTGSFNLNHKLLYNITYKTSIFFPNEGTILKNCKIIFNSDILYIAQYKKYNCIILLPKAFFKSQINIKNNINIICLDKHYELNDKFMFIIGIPENNNIITDNISITDNNDLKCSSILQNITDYKNEYYNLFYSNQTENTTTVNIDYDLYDFNQKINNILIDLKNNLIQHINTNKSNFDSLYIENINNFYDLTLLLDYLNITYNDDLYIKYKNSIFSNFNEEIYNSEKEKDLNIKIVKLIQYNKGITNNLNYCYITSTIQALKNSKLFLLDFKNLDKSTIDSNKRDIFQELEELFFNDKNNIQDLITYLTKYIEENQIKWNFNNMNDINDFILILFNIIDKKEIINISKHIYSEINDPEFTKNIPASPNEFDNIPIKDIILQIKQTYESSILKYFYNIEVAEYKCSSCGYKHFNIRNKVINELFINNNSYDNIQSFINSKYNNNSYENIIGLKCPVCNNISINRNLSLYIDNINYLITSINRYNFKSFLLEKNQQLINIDNRFSLQTIDLNKSINSIEYKNNIFDLKSLIIHNGSYNNGHYITINKDKSDIFYLYNDVNHFKMNYVDFFNSNLLKENSYTFIYQSNIIHDLPLSDISLLQYEHNLLNEYSDSITEYIKNKVQVGVHVGPSILLGGHLFESLENIHYLYNNYSSLINIDEFKNILNDFYSLYLNNPKHQAILQNFNTKYNKSDSIKSDTIEEFLTDQQTDLKPIDSFFKYYFIYKLINQIELTFNPLNQISFISNIDFLNNKNIFLGTAGYNSSETNHWDIIYQRTTNNLDLYSEHMNSIEINHSYYNDYDIEHWQDILSKIKSLKSKLNLSIIFNKELSDLLSNSTESVNESDFMKVFNKYFDKKISILIDFIDNIVFKFESNFIYNDNNFNNISLFNNISQLPIIQNNDINIVFEFYHSSWYNQIELNSFFINSQFTLASLIFNNDDNRFGNSLESNLFDLNKSNLNYMNNNFKINYIKLYGSNHKYSGSHIKELPYLINNVKDKLNLNLLNKISSDNKIKQYIYFNNIETDKNNNKYSDDEDNTNIPASIYDAKLFYKALERLDIL